MKKLKPFLILLLLVAVSCFIQAEAAKNFVHPGIPFTRSDIDLLKANITREPWKTGYAKLSADGKSSLDYGMQGPFVTVSRAPNLNNTAWKNDMVAIYNLTLMWVFSGNDAYAAKATDMLDKWAVTNTVWSGSENLLDIGDYAPFVVPAADILKSMYSGWTVANTTHVNSYFANVLYPTSGVPYPLRDNNKGALQSKTALSIAAFLNDETKWNNAIEGFRIDAGGGLRCSLPNGEVGDAGRDNHWLVQASALAWGAEVAWKQGVDMFAELDNRLLAISELYNKYAFVGDTMTFIPFGGYAAYWGNWGIQPGMRNQDFMNSIIHSAYALRKGIPTPWTDKMRESEGEGALSFMYLKSEDNSTATAMTPIVFPTTEPVIRLSNLNIGNTGIAGSAGFENGIWTQNGAGASVANSVNYTFKPVHGDFCIIAKVENSSISTGVTGLMFRESLSTTAKNISLNLYNGTVNTRYNGNVSGYTHYTPKAPWWLKLERVGNRIFSYHSADGTHWSNHNQIYEATSINAYVGMFSLSNNTSALNTATFSNVSITNTTPVGAPEITSAISATATVGTPFNYSIKTSGSATKYSVSNLPKGLAVDTLTGVISGTPDSVATYALTMSAINATGSGMATLVLTINGKTTPSAPGGVAAEVVNTNQIKVSWTASANTSGYIVKRSLTSGGPYAVVQSCITGTSFIDANPVPEVNNYYVATAISGTLESGNSQEVYSSVPPAIPSTPVTLNKNNQIDLSWQPALGASTYNVKRGTAMGGPYSTIANVSVTTFSDMMVTNGNPYYYVVSSVGKKYESGNSVEVFDVPGATSVTWSGIPTSKLWSQSDNWKENITPTSPAIITLKATTDSVMTNDLTGLNVSRFLFDTDASSDTISGNAITMGYDIVNNSEKPQVINTPLVLNNDLTVNVNTQNVTLTGVISGTGGLRRLGTTGMLYVSGNNTYSGNTIIGGSGYISLSGAGTGTPGAPTSGPLGTGKIIMDGGTLNSSGTDATLYNDIEITAGKRSYVFESTTAIILKGRLTGSGTFWQDGNSYAGLQMFGDNSNFTGTFVCALRSGNNRLRFNVPESGSAKAIWNLDANGIDCQSLNFPTGTIHFGALTGRGYFRNNAGGTPVMSIGALNLSTWFGGTINGTIGVEKVGTADLNFTGNHTYSSETNVRGGRLLLNNNALTGVFNSPVNVYGGAFGGTGRCSGMVTVGMGTGEGPVLEPGDVAIGTLTTTSTLTLNQDATYNVELDFNGGTSDKVIAGNVVLNNAQLSLIEKVAGSLQQGTNFTIISNTGSTPITGTFKDLPDMAIVKVGDLEFRITYKGGDGNDVVLLDNRAITNTVPVVLQKLSATALSSSQIKIKWDASPASDYVSGYTIKRSVSSDGTYTTLSTGLKNNEYVDNGLTPESKYYYKVFAGNFMGDGTESAPLMAITLPVTIPQVPANLKAQAGPNLVWLSWSSAKEAASYNVKRSTVGGGPYKTIANVTDTIYKDATAVNGTIYYYVVSGKNALYESDNCKEVAIAPSVKAWSYWPFNEGTGAVATDIWSGRNATAYGNTWGSGISQSAVRLDGTAASYIQMPNGFVNTLTDFSVSTWVKLDAQANWARIWDFGRGTSYYMFLTSNIGSATKPVRYAIKAGGAEQVINSTFVIPVGKWTHIVVTKSGNTGIMYINGVEAGRNESMTISPSNLGDLNQNYIGKSQYTADAMLKGTVDEIRIYNSVLTPSEVSELYNIAIPGTPVNLSVTLVSNKVVLGWNAVSGATGYTVKRATVSGGAYTTIKTDITENAFTDETAPGGTFYYVVTATSNGFEGLVSNEASVSLTAGLNSVVSGSLQVYPNPVKEELNILTDMESNATYKVQLLDVNGQVKQIDEIAGGKLKSLNLKALSPGVYFLKIDGKEEVRKIIKL